MEHKETSMTDLSPQAQAIVDAYEGTPYNADMYSSIAAVLRVLIDGSEPRGTGRVDKKHRVVSVKTLMELAEELEQI